jgi:hypothetical protein
MKTIQGMLAQYFIMKNSDTNIDFVSSANKLSQFRRDKECTKVTYGNPAPPSLHSENNKLSAVKPLENTIINADYKQHKKDGLYYCSQVIQKNACFTGWSESLHIKKADDLADSFLQGLWFIANKLVK